MNLPNIRTYAGKTFPVVLRSLRVMEIPDRISIEVLETTSMCPAQPEHTYISYIPFYVGVDVLRGVGSGSCGDKVISYINNIVGDLFLFKRDSSTVVFV